MILLTRMWVLPAELWIGPTKKENNLELINRNQFGVNQADLGLYSQEKQGVQQGLGFGLITNGLKNLKMWI